MITFTTDKIRVRNGEDENINPGCYGMYLAREVRNSLRQLGYTAKAGTEDWGWYIVIRKKPYFQWVGCRNITEIDFFDGKCTSENIEWGITIVNECGFMHRLRNRGQVKIETDTLRQQIEMIIKERYSVTVQNE